MSATEVNFDGIVGLTHHYAGLSFGNVASVSNQHQVANPKLAALQGLRKMKALADLGFPQAVLPPQERPHVALLRQLGFTGSDSAVLRATAQQAPHLLAGVSSASAMWTANAATISPSADTLDHKVHLTVANLNNKFHRAIEAPQTEAILRAIFTSPQHFQIHSALPPVSQFGDEGAANHNRLCDQYGAAGVELFVYGRDDRNPGAPAPVNYPARQTREASEAIVRLHQLPAERVVLAQQNPAVIDQGVFHNDVISVANRNQLFFHEQAFLNSNVVLAELREKLAVQGAILQPICVPTDAVSVSDAVQSYLFNSQLLSHRDGRTVLVVPVECQQNPRVWAYLTSMIGQGIDTIEVFDLWESMRNGGGPACLRLRVVLTDAEQAVINPHVMLTESRYQQLTLWVERHYRDRLTETDLADPMLLDETRSALDELTQLLHLGAIYPFQRV